MYSVSSNSKYSNFFSLPPSGYVIVDFSLPLSVNLLGPSVVSICFASRVSDFKEAVFMNSKASTRDIGVPESSEFTASKGGTNLEEEGFVVFDSVCDFLKRN